MVARPTRSFKQQAHRIPRRLRRCQSLFRAGSRSGRLPLRASDQARSGYAFDRERLARTGLGAAVHHRRGTAQFANSSTVRSYLGEETAALYAETKPLKVARFRKIISAVEYDWYL